MDHPYIAEHNLAARYVLGTLPPDESARFEEHFVDCPECLSEIEATLNFRDGYKTLAVSDPVAIQWPAPSRWPAYVAWAASIVLVVSAGVFVFQLQRVRREAGYWATLYTHEKQARELTEGKLAQAQQQAELPAAIPIFSLMLTRGGSTETANRIALPRSPQPLILSLDRAGLPDFPAYRGRLEDVAGNVVWTGDRLQPVSRDALGISVQSRLLREGRYVLAIEGLLRDGRAVPAGRYAFTTTTLQR